MERYAVRGRLLLGDALVPGAVVIRGAGIVEIIRDARDGDLPPDVREADIIAPGLIDMQVNGAYGVEVGVEPDAIATLAARLPEQGVTTFLPTLVTSPVEKILATYAHWRAHQRAPGARPLGIHLEGPFLSPARKGAHVAALIEAASPDLPARIDNLAQGGFPLRLITVAPERPDAFTVIRHFRAGAVVVALGHTDATYEQFVAGVDAGGVMATHLYNTMSPFTHRAPGAIGAALVDDRVTVCLIADGIHSHPASLALAVRAKGPERVALVSDAMPAAEMPPGQYALGGLEVTVDETSARLADGTLAGSILALDQAVRNMVRWAGVTPAHALRMASETPARLLGLHGHGRLAVNARADLALFDADLHVTATIRDGVVVYERQARGNAKDAKNAKKI